ncbi:MAG: tape measure protein [Methylovulum sp.]|nr:tape measure protein [Methylovulum sp.]
MSDQRLQLRIQILGDSGNLRLEVRNASGEIVNLGRTGRQAGQELSSGFSAASLSANNLGLRLLDVNSAGRQLVSALSLLALVSTGKNLLELADTLHLLEGRIRVASAGVNDNVQAADDFKTAYAGLLDISLRTGTSFEANATLFARVNQAMLGLGGTTKNTIALTDLMAKSLAISGASSEMARSATIQLSQALASGVLRGDEFNSLNENASRFVEALATGLGVTRGQLRQMAEAGQLTAEIVINAILSQSKAIEDSYGQLPNTVGRSLERVKTAFGQYVADVDKGTGATAGLSDAFDLLAVHIVPALDGVVTVGKIYALVVGGQLVKSMVAATAAQIEQSIITRAHSAALLENNLRTVQQAEAEVAATAARAAETEADVALVLSLRGEATARLAAVNATIAQHNAAIAAMRTTVQTSSVQYLLRQETMQLTAAEQRRAVVIAELSALDERNTGVINTNTAALEANAAAQARLDAARMAANAGNLGFIASLKQMATAANALNLAMAAVGGYMAGQWLNDFSLFRTTATGAIDAVMRKVEDLKYQTERNDILDSWSLSSEEKQKSLADLDARHKATVLGFDSASESIKNYEATLDKAGIKESEYKSLSLDIRSPEAKFNQESAKLTQLYNGGLILPDSGETALEKYTKAFLKLHDTFLMSVGETPFSKELKNLNESLDKAKLSARELFEKHLRTGDGDPSKAITDEAKIDTLMAKWDAVQAAEAAKQLSGKLEKGVTEALQNAFAAATAKYQLPNGLLQAVAKTETGGSYRTDLVSPKGAVGLMQFMPATAKRFGVADRTDPAQSIEGAAKYLKVLSDKFNGDLKLTIAAYNAGEGAVTGGYTNSKGVYIPPHKPTVPNFPETQAYVPKVLAAMDNLQNNPVGNTLTELYKSAQTLQKSQQEATTKTNESRIEIRLKTATDTAQNTIESLRILKEQGRVGIDEYYAALTQAQETAVNANIEAVRAKIAENQRQSQQAQLSAKPEDLPALTAEFAAKNASLSADLKKYQNELGKIKTVNLFDKQKEQKDLDDVVAQVRLRLAELRNETNNDPLAIKARVEFDNADTLKKLRSAGQGGLAGDYVNALSAAEQAKSIQDDIGLAQQRTQTQETRINLLQQSGSLSKFQAQQQLKALYQQQADEIDRLSEKLSALGDNPGMDDLKLKALDAKNAAIQLRLTLPSLKTQLVDAGQAAAINGMANAMVNLTNETQTAGQAFAGFGLSVVQAIQQIAAQKLAGQILGAVFNMASLPLSGTGSTATATSFGGGSLFKQIDGAVGSSLPGAFAAGGYIDNALKIPLPPRKFAVGGLITGPGTETSDSINGLLPPGSFVIKAASAKPVLSSLQALVKNVQDGVPPAGGVPVRLSNNEFLVPPEAVKRYGLPFFDHINKTGALPKNNLAKINLKAVLSDKPPAALQRAAGGLVGSSASVAAPPSSGNAISFNLPINITNNNDNPSGSAPGKLDVGLLQAFAKDLQSQVDARVQHHMRPGGLLYSVFRKG